MPVLYQKLNRILIQDGEDRFLAYSFGTLVLEVVNGKIVKDCRTGLNYSNRRSPTSSKHATQAMNYLEENNFI